MKHNFKGDIVNLLDIEDYNFKNNDILNLMKFNRKTFKEYDETLFGTYDSVSRSNLIKGLMETYYREDSLVNKNTYMKNFGILWNRNIIGLINIIAKNEEVQDLFQNVSVITKTTSNESYSESGSKVSVKEDDKTEGRNRNEIVNVDSLVRASDNPNTTVSGSLLDQYVSAATGTDSNSDFMSEEDITTKGKVNVNDNEESSYDRESSEIVEGNELGNILTILGSIPNLELTFNNFMNNFRSLLIPYFD